MNDIVWIIVWVVLIGAIFGWLWRAGHLERLTRYVRQTREELRKCTWPSWEELKGSTLIVAISIVLLGGFTVLVDLVFSMLVRLVTA
jgi:preprotein translocase subunit SecE